MFTVIGIERKVGTYEGNVYDNTYLYCTYEKKNVQGLCVLSAKVKTALLDDVITEGAKVSFLYDRYGNVVSVSVH